MARNACLAWHMLACCPGFRGHENDSFWKKLVEHVGSERASNSNKDGGLMQREEAASDAYKFFPPQTSTTKTAFPRFRLHIPFSEFFDSWGYEIDDDDLDIDSSNEWISNVVRTFIGLANAFEDPNVRRCANELTSFIDLGQYSRTPVEIGVHLGDAHPFEDLAHTLRDLIASIDTDALARREEQYAWRLLGQSRFPLAKFTELCLSDHESIADEESVRDLPEIINTCDIFIPEVHISPTPEKMGEDGLFDFMQLSDAIALPGQVVSVRWDST